MLLEMVFLAEVDDAMLGGLKTIGIVLVSAAFVAIVIRSLGSRSSEMTRGASMALSDGKPAGDPTADPTVETSGDQPS